MSVDYSTERETIGSRDDKKHCGNNGNLNYLIRKHPSQLLAICYRVPPNNPNHRPSERWNRISLVQKGARRQKLFRLGILKTQIKELPELTVLDQTINLKEYQCVLETKYSCPDSCKSNSNGYCETMVLRLEQELKECSKLNGSAPDLITVRCTGMTCPIDIPGRPNIMAVSHYKRNSKQMHL